MTTVLGFGSSFGIMQGRLSPLTSRGYQAFPWESWEKEFDQAAIRHFDHIEWVLDSWRLEENPILESPSDVMTLCAQSGVRVVSVCADFLMDTPLDASTRDTWLVMERLITGMQAVGARWLILPCVDQASIRVPQSLQRLTSSLRLMEQLLAGTSVSVALETDLDPNGFRDLLKTLNPEHFAVNYDMGNSASLGYEYRAEIDAYGERIAVVHIKDRTLSGPSVKLGNGHAPIREVFNGLRQIGFSGAFTMQAFRDQDGLKVLDHQLAWLLHEVGT